MFKNLISHRQEDACVYLHCGHSNKIICNFYYKATPSCEEIIGLLYFGPIVLDETKTSTIISFSLASFSAYLQELRNCYYLEGEHNAYVETVNGVINIYKKNEDYTTIRVTKTKKTLDKNTWLWEVSIRHTELLQYLEELEKIKQIIIMETHTNVKTTNK
jgi:hypothetical protein